MLGWVIDLPFFLLCFSFATASHNLLYCFVKWGNEYFFPTNRHRKRVHCSHHCKLLALLELAATSSFSHIIYVYVQRGKIADSLPDPNNRRRRCISCVNCNHHRSTIIAALANASDRVRERVNLLVGEAFKIFTTKSRCEGNITIFNSFSIPVYVFVFPAP